MAPSKLTRPSLRIIRRLDQERASNFMFEAWNPFTGEYEHIASMTEGMQRVDRLARLISWMWVHGDPKQDLLADVPDGDPPDESRWAELRVNATSTRTYETREHDQPGWIRAMSITQAAITICGSVGYALPQRPAPARPAPGA